MNLCIILIIFLKHVCALYMIRYHRINEYFQRFPVDSSAEFEDYFLDLPDLHARQVICDLVINARQYLIVNKHKSPHHTSTHTQNVEFINLQRFKKYEEPDSIWYVKRFVSLDGNHKNKIQMKLLECVWTEDENWFVVVLKREEKMFLIESMRTRKDLLTIEGLLEPEGVYDPIECPDTLYQYFSDQAQAIAQRTNRNEMPLCQISFEDHGRVCSAAFEGLARSQFGNMGRLVKYMNYIQIPTRRCVFRRVKVISGDVIRIKVLTCAINQRYTSPLFYVLADEKTSGAGFILDSNNGFGHKPTKVIGRLERLAVLRDLQNPGTSRDEANEHS